MVRTEEKLKETLRRFLAHTKRMSRLAYGIVSTLEERHRMLAKVSKK